MEITHLVLSYVDSGRLTGIELVNFCTKVKRKKNSNAELKTLGGKRGCFCEEESML